MIDALRPKADGNGPPSFQIINTDRYAAGKKMKDTGMTDGRGKRWQGRGEEEGCRAGGDVLEKEKEENKTVRGQ